MDMVSAERMASYGARCIAMNGALLKLNGFSRMEFFSDCASYVNIV